MIEPAQNRHIRHEAKLVSDLIVTIKSLDHFSVEQQLCSKLHRIFDLPGILSNVSYERLNTSLVDMAHRFKFDQLSMTDFVAGLKNILNNYQNAKRIPVAANLAALRINPQERLPEANRIRSNSRG